MQSTLNVKSISACKEQINNLAGLAVSKYFYSNNGPPPEPVTDTLRLLMDEADQVYRPLVDLTIRSIEEALPINETCQPQDAVHLVEVAEKHRIPGYTWEKLITDTIISIAEIWLARGMAERNPKVITQAYAILNGDLTHLTDLTYLTEITKFNANLTLFNAASDLSRSDKKRFQGNLLGEIKQYVCENKGSFTTTEIDKWFGITHPADKSIRRQACFLLLKNKEIRKDKRIIGKYHIIKDDINLIDLNEIEAEPFAINLPINLQDIVKIPKKSIIVIAGTSNAGKTALALNILQHNLNQPYPLYYLMSEMGPSEYKGRISKVIDDMQEWNKKVNAADVSTGFDGVILHRNPDGITVIDFLEDVDGEYYKIGSDIRSIYDSLGEGIAVVCLQKHTKAEVGRGGEATTEKARLYLTMDILHHQPRCTIVAVKIIKAKDYQGDNPNGKEIHVKIKAGSIIEPISDWMYCNLKQREQYIKRYQHQLDKGFTKIATDDKACCYRMLLEDGAFGNILQKDVDTWKANMPDIDVENLLSWLERKTKNDEIRLTRKSWFMQIAGILSKKQKEKLDEKNEPF